MTGTAGSRAHWYPAYVGLGSNLAQPARQVAAGFAALAGLADTLLVARSSLYRSPPMGPSDQPDYVNAAAGLLTTLAPEALLQSLQAIEAAHGRRRDGERWGPRTLDLDLLVYGREDRPDDPMLTLPHPGIAERAFVLRPLHEIAPGLQVPRHGSVARLLRAVDARGVVPLGEA